ncbi:hypothetical protein [Rhizobium leguminosarum]|uniref:hypothetical protein n=1 Tax=Rhizobium leguminosarum TaxID=384 RepID=UPI001C9058D9|nr:hypothetical protein [Rhizobium leguminosarum]MBY2973091.1 hypothetical protein [Rhizobium leguminosarum]MBY2980491.1 hypothetical protein [Rhizobium leguminosarum]MBY3009042.1 hypothetical protein [Rhizobium leguminosarum]
MSSPLPTVERNILVFATWAILGFLGVGLFLEGLTRDSVTLSSLGVTSIVLAFVAHIVINGVFETGFTPGEAALGIGAYGLLGFVFVIGAAIGETTKADFYSGLVFFGVLVVGFLAYLFTRHGLRGAFSRFHVKPASLGEGV